MKSLNRRSLVAFLLAVLMLTLSVSPSLAWFVEDEMEFQPTETHSKIVVNSNGLDIPHALMLAE